MARVIGTSRMATYWCKSDGTFHQKVAIMFENEAGNRHVEYEWRELNDDAAE